MEEQYLINQRVHEVTFLGAMQAYFIGAFSFKGYTTRKGYFLALLGAGILYGLLQSFSITSLISDFSKYSSDTSSSVGGGFIFLQILSIIILFPSLALDVRRRRDAGMTIKGMAVLTVLAFIPVIRFFVFLANIYVVVQPSDKLLTDKPNHFFFRQRSETSEEQSANSSLSQSSPVASASGTVEEERGLEEPIKGTSNVVFEKQDNLVNAGSLFEQSAEEYHDFNQHSSVAAQTVPIAVESSQGVSMVCSEAGEREQLVDVHHLSEEEWVALFVKRQGRDPLLQEFMSAREQGFPSLESNNEELVTVLSEEGSKVQQDNSEQATHTEGTSNLKALLVEENSASLLLEEKLVEATETELLKQSDNQDELEDLQEEWVSFFQASKGRAPFPQEILVAKQEGFLSLPSERGELGHLLDGNSPVSETEMTLSNQITDSKESIKQAKDEWLDHFQAFHGRNPLPQEYLVAKNQGFNRDISFETEDSHLSSSNSLFVQGQMNLQGEGAESTQVTEEKNVVTSDSSMKRFRFGKRLWILLLLLFLLAGSYWTWQISLLESQEINLADYSISLTVSGEDGQGSAEVLVEEIPEFANMSEEVKRFLEHPKVSISPRKNLSNGDRVEVEISLNETKAKKLGLKIEGEFFEYFKVDGLEGEVQKVQVKEIADSEEFSLSVENIRSASATSYLSEPQYQLFHSPTNLLDGDLSTAWVEDVSGQGIGESLTFQFDRVYGLTGLKLATGYQKNVGLFEKNSRPSKVRLGFSDGTSQEFQLEDEQGYQMIRLVNPVETNTVTMTILAVYPGTDYQDTAISEIELFVTESAVTESSQATQSSPSPELEIWPAYKQQLLADYMLSFGQEMGQPNYQRISITKKINWAGAELRENYQVVDGYEYWYDNGQKVHRYIFVIKDGVEGLVLYSDEINSSGYYNTIRTQNDALPGAFQDIVNR